MPWWTEELREFRAKTRSHLKAWSSCKTEQSEICYRRRKSNFQRALRAAKCKAWSDFRSRATSGDTFKALASFSGKFQSISLPPALTVSGVLTSDPATKADACASHFFSTETSSDDSHFIIDELANSVTDSSLSVHPIPAISVWEYETAIASLNPNSAPGTDGISAGLLLLSLPYIKPFLLIILNACLFLCFFPASWKISKVVVLSKPNKQDYTSLNIFRPISLLGNLAKILEKIILGRLYWTAYKFELLSSNQHGFRESHSTDTAAHSLTFFIESAFSEKKFCASAFWDIKSAFDLAWHPAIIAALSRRLCPPYLIKTVLSFLSIRKALISINGGCFKKLVHIGCRQGNVLSPFLWNLLVDDLLRTTFPFPIKFVAYADDITVATIHKDAVLATRNLQLVCHFVGKWLAARKAFS